VRQSFKRFAQIAVTNNAQPCHRASNVTICVEAWLLHKKCLNLYCFAIKMDYLV
jgi:hypothetical protein